MTRGAVSRAVRAALLAAAAVLASAASALAQPAGSELLERARTVAAEGRTEEAMALAERAEAGAGSPAEKSAARLLTAALLVRSAEAALDPAAVLERARLLYEASLPEAPAEMRPIAAANLAALYLRLGWNAAAQRRFADAEPEMLAAEAVPPQARAAFHYNYGRALEETEEPQAAREQYLKGLRQDPSFRLAAEAAFRLALASGLAGPSLAAAAEVISGDLDQKLLGEAEARLRQALAHRPWLEDPGYRELVTLLVRYLVDGSIGPREFDERWRERLAPLRDLAARAGAAILEEVFAAYDRELDLGDASRGVRAPGHRAESDEERRLFARLLATIADGYRAQATAAAERQAAARYDLALQYDPGAVGAAFAFADTLRQRPELDPGNVLLADLAQRMDRGSVLAGLEPVTGARGDVRLETWQSAAALHQMLGEALEDAEQWRQALAYQQALRPWLPEAAGAIATLETRLAVGTVRDEVVVTDEIVLTGEPLLQPPGTFVVPPEQIASLPINRSIADIARLAPGVLADGGHLSISGSTSSENLFYLDGVNVTDAYGSPALDVFIEDAIEDFTVQTAGISAVYGRFTGGVVDTTTRSGGNELSGSLELGLDRQTWREPTPLTRDRRPDVDGDLEGTLGGFFWRDHLWFFVAARDHEEERFDTLPYTLLPAAAGHRDERVEGKLTAALGPAHQLAISFLAGERRENGSGFGALDLSALSDGRDSQEALALTYSGVVTPELFAEVRAARRDAVRAAGAGAASREPRGGTWIGDAARSAVHGAPLGCGVCPAEERRTDQLVAKLTYYFAAGPGDHDLVVGYDRLDGEVRRASPVSGSDFVAMGFSPAKIRGSAAFPLFRPGSADRLEWRPLLDPRRGAEVTSEAFFVNDTWRLGDHWSLNLGWRYDRNRASDAGGEPLADDHALSPRLSVSWDPSGRGRWTLRAGLGRYASGALDLLDRRLAGSAGATADLHWLYDGAPINDGVDEPGALLDAGEALAAVFDWFDALGGTADRSRLSRVEIPGVTTRLAGRLSSPRADEATLGLSLRFGRAHRAAVDVVHREISGFYAPRTVPGHRVATPFGSADLALLANDDRELERAYDALNARLDLRFASFRLGASWSWSHARGREPAPAELTRGDFPDLARYGELKDFEQHNPRGDLAVDVRHRASVWLTWQALDEDPHRLELSLLHSFETGRPYGAVGAVDSRPFVDLERLGYAFPPPAVPYYFSPRDAFRTDDVLRTDLALTYTHVATLWDKEVDFFVKPQVTNLFDRAGVVRVGTTVLDATNAGLAPFDPFTETPIEGVHWARGDDFGRPTGEGDFQTPRTFRLSLGLRF